MAMMFFAQSFTRKGRKLELGPAVPFRTSEAAVEEAKRLAPTRAGVWAYSQNVDQATDSYDDPVVLFKAGDLPPGLGE